MEISQPRYSAEYKQKAKERGAVLFTLDLDRRFLTHKGGRATVQGVATPEHYKFLRLAKLIVDDIPLAEAIERAELGDVLSAR